jgi:hypothetical protein
MQHTDKACAGTTCDRKGQESAAELIKVEQIDMRKDRSRNVEGEVLQF